MIQFNLLPDVKLEYLKAQRTKRLAMTGAFIATAAAVTLLVVLFGYGQLQKKHLNDLNLDIKAESSKLKGQPNIDKVLTVQNQLKSLTTLHDAKPATARLFGYLNQVTPATVAITSFSVDFNTQEASITGTADSISSINKYVDTLKFAEYNLGDATSKPAFSDVVLTSFSLTGDSTGGQPASYTINLKYDKTLFDITQKANVVVRNQITTRSQLQSTDGLFQNAPVKPATKASN